MPTPLMLTKKEVLALLNVSDYELQKLEEAGVLHPMSVPGKLGRAVLRYPRSEIMRLARVEEVEK